MLSLLDGKAEQPILFNRGSIYSISEIKQLPDTGAIIAAKKAIIANANKRLKEEGEMDMVLGLKDFNWILDHTTYEERILTNFLNSGKSKSGAIAYFLNERFEGTVAVFKYKRLTLVIFKPKCFNPLIVDPEIKPLEVKKPDPIHDTLTIVKDAPKVLSMNNGWNMGQRKIVTDYKVTTSTVEKKKVNIFPWLAIGIPTAAGIAGLIYLATRNSGSNDSSTGGSNPSRSGGSSGGPSGVPTTGGPSGVPTN